MPSLFIAGLDLGQTSDPTALAIVKVIPPTYPAPVLGPVLVERTPRAPGRALLPQLQVRHLERFPLGTRYPTIVTEVGDLLKNMLAGQSWRLVVDRTGVGRGVFDCFIEAGLNPVGISITAGDTPNRDDGGWKVPKRDLVGAVLVPLHQERLKFAKGLPEVDVLIKELLNFKVKITASANDTYSAWREADHDDYVLALGCACWWAGKQTPFNPAVAAQPNVATGFVVR